MTHQARILIEGAMRTANFNINKEQNVISLQLRCCVVYNVGIINTHLPYSVVVRMRTIYLSFRFIDNICEGAI